MKDYYGKLFAIFILLNVFFCLIAPAAVLAHGGSHGEEQEHGPWEEAATVIGGATALLFGIANITAIIGVAVRVAVGSGPPTATWKERLTRWNRRQKKMLLGFHYLLNPIAVLMAGLHWSILECGWTSFQKFGLPLLAGWVALGLAAKLQLAPRSWRPRMFKIHSTWVIPAALFVLVVIGHALTES